MPRVVGDLNSEAGDQKKLHMQKKRLRGTMRLRKRLRRTDEMERLPVSESQASLTHR